MLQQLEMIFINFERHPFYSEIFNMAGGDPKLQMSLCCTKDILAACASTARVQLDQSALARS